MLQDLGQLEEGLQLGLMPSGPAAWTGGVSPAVSSPGHLPHIDWGGWSVVEEPLKASVSSQGRAEGGKGEGRCAEDKDEGCEPNLLKTHFSSLAPPGSPLRHASPHLPYIVLL